MAPLDELDRITAACNTGPLISAFQCTGTELLRRYMARLVVVPAELSELERHGWKRESDELVSEGFVVVASGLSEVEKDQAASLARRIAAHHLSGNADPSNHLPEAEMLVIALRPDLRCRIVLLDEKAARAVAMEIGLRVTGFPGILARAGVDGLVSKADIYRLLNSCQQQGTHYSDALIGHVVGVYGR